MIKSVADLLQAFSVEERKRLDQQNIDHAPTIGAMYEGLSRETLARAIPEELDLRIVDGFAYVGERQSGQLDGMLVHGEGEEIPYTGSYRWHIKDVIAVLEVKKTLTAENLFDSHFHLREVDQLYTEYLLSGEDGASLIDVTFPSKIFSQITGVVAPDYSEIHRLPFELQLIYHTIICEFLGPIRVVVGHHGWKKEETLREHIYKLLVKRIEEDPEGAGLGAGSFPHLIIGGDFSLIKANGFPYSPPMIDGMWPFLCSSRHNPTRLLLEIIWARLDRLFGLGDFWGNETDQEALSPCLSTIPRQLGDRVGWEYHFISISEARLKSRGDTEEWRPAELIRGQEVIIHLLCAGKEVDVTDSDFFDFIVKNGWNVEDFIASLISTRLVARNGNLLVLTTDHCQVVVTREGKIVAAENCDGQLTKWLAKNLIDKE